MQTAQPRAALWSWRWVVVAAAALAALLLIERWQSRPVPVDQPEERAAVLTAGPRNFSEALAQLDAAIINAEAQAAAGDDQFVLMHQSGVIVITS